MAALESEPLKVRKCSIHFVITKYAREDAVQDVYMGNKFLALRKSEVAKAAPDRAALMRGHKNSKWYLPLFELSKKSFGDNIWAYYYDLTFAETLIIHRTKSNKDDFGKEEMLKWWNEKDFIEIIPEKNHFTRHKFNKYR